MMHADNGSLDSSDAPHRMALCLSGGGYRAAIFHLGALRRLNELGALSRVDLISSVSGGSILAGHLVTYMKQWPELGQPFDNWKGIEESFRAFVKRNIRTWPVLKRFLLPWNWFRPSTQVWALEATYQRRLTPLTMTELPDHPRFVFCATDMVNGVSWVFEKTRVGSYLAGYLKPAPDWPVARAVAASSCFPPVFDPMPIRAPDGQAGARFAGMSVSDGGLYDNLGLQPAAQCETVLSSDGGAPFIAAVPHGLIGRFKAYLSVMGRQAGALRKQYLIASFDRNDKAGTYWGIDSSPQRYEKDLPPDPKAPPPVGYSKDLAVSRIASIRTDLDAFSDAEIKVLTNHGYCLADVALRAHATALITNYVEFAVPYPEWMNESRVADALRYSNKRFRIVRWFFRVAHRLRIIS